MNWYIADSFLYHPALSSVKHFFTTSALGDMTNLGKDKATFLPKNINTTNIITTEQVHGSKIHMVSHFDRGKKIPSADGLISNVTDTALAVFIADCVPMFIFDPVSKTIGLVHIGWRGLAKGIVENSITLWNNAGTDIKNTVICLGPHICGNCYSISEDIGKNFLYGFKNGYLSFATEIKSRLINAGIRDKNIHSSQYCTYHHSNLFFSYRKNKTNSRSMALIAL